MSFKDDLERQLFAAAERERRAGPFFGLRRVADRAAPALAGAALAVAAVCVVVLAGGGGGEPQPTLTTPVRPSLVEGPANGIYVSRRSGAGKVRLLIVPSAYQLRAPQLYLYGALQLRGDSVSFVRPPGNARLPRGLSRAERDDCLLPSADGVYRWSQRGRRLRLETVEDPCDPRRRVLGGAIFTLQEP